jgi:hypothetical protein
MERLAIDQLKHIDEAEPRSIPAFLYYCTSYTWLKNTAHGVQVSKRPHFHLICAAPNLRNKPENKSWCLRGKIFFSESVSPPERSNCPALRGSAQRCYDIFLMLTPGDFQMVSSVSHGMRWAPTKHGGGL